MTDYWYLIGEWRMVRGGPSLEETIRSFRYAHFPHWPPPFPTVEAITEAQMWERWLGKGGVR